MRTSSGDGVGQVPAGTVRSATRAARPAAARGSVRPGGRRGGAPLPAVRPAVAGGRGPLLPVRVPSPAVARRRRLVALAATVATVLAVGLLLGVALSSPAAAAVDGASTVTVVRAGESLQDVARRTALGTDERAAAAAIRDLNDLPSSVVVPGRPLVVPVR